MKRLNGSGRRWSVAGLLLGLAVMAGLAGCAGPRYATEVRYLPPTTEAGLSCIQGCQTDRQACQSDCRARRESCIADIGPKADAAFEEALRRYEAQRRVYLRELQFYRLDRAMHVGFYRDPFYFGYPGPFWYTDRYLDDPPIPPEAPDRAAIRQQLIDQQCSLQCGCQGAFDQCYVGCGGQVERRVVCIENCDGETPVSRIPPAPAGGQGDE